MAKVIFTNDAVTILAAIPLAKIRPFQPHQFVSAKAREVLAGKGRRLRRINQARGDSTFLKPALGFDNKRSE